MSPADADNLDLVASDLPNQGLYKLSADIQRHHVLAARLGMFTEAFCGFWNLIFQRMAKVFSLVQNRHNQIRL